MNANPENPDSAGLGAGRSPLAVAVAALVGATSVGFLLLFAAVALFRMRFPFELEWVEGLMLDHVRRVVAGLPTYPPPSLDFISAPYTPLYYYVSAVAAVALGDGFFPLRLVSALAACGCFALLFAIVRRETGSALWGLFAAGLFAASYRACGAWLDLARVDSLALFLLLATTAAVRFGESRGAAVAAGLLAAATVFTKQTMLPALALLSVWAVVARWRRSGLTLALTVWAAVSRGWRGLLTLATFAIAAGAACWALDRASAGWFWRYCFVFEGQPLTGHAPWAFWTKFVAAKMPFAALAAGAYFATAGRRQRAAEAWFYGAALAGACGVSWLAYTKVGGYDNNFLPAAAMLALVAALGAAAAAPWAKARPLGAAALCVACLAQFALLRYDPARQVPAAEEAQAGRRFLDVLRVFPGDLFIAAHSYIGPLLGKPTHAHLMSWSDRFQSHDEATKRALLTELTAAVEARRFDAIVLDDLEYPHMRIALCHYRYVGELFHGNEFYPATGLRTRPEFLFVRNDLPLPGN